MWLSKVIIQVWPSGADLAATAEPTAPVPPGLLSMMMFQPVLSISLAWMMRATGSVEPPGGKGTMILIWPLGQSAGACGDGGRAERGGERRRSAANGVEASTYGKPPEPRLACRHRITRRSEIEKGLPSGSLPSQRISPPPAISFDI